MYEAHPAALLFPLIDGAAFDALVEDIREHGLLDSIVLLDGKVLDGRNRQRACDVAGVTPTYTIRTSDDTPSPVEYVVSRNLHRRHLTVAQLAGVGLDLLPMRETEAKERQRAAGELIGRGQLPIAHVANDMTYSGAATAEVARMVGIGPTTMRKAKAIQRKDVTGDVVARMRSGELNVSQAAREVGFEAMGGDATPGKEVAAMDNGNRTKDGRSIPTYFGRGDKWAESSTPLKRYLAGAEKRGYAFGHVNPRDARKRMEAIDALIEGLARTRIALEERSHEYRLTA